MDPVAEQTGGRGLRLGTLAGIEIRLDPSLLIVFVLVVGSLGLGVLALWHPQWPFAARWGTAILAGVAFFASILVHELAHALVARLYGIAVPRITLFLFGGVSEVAEEPRTPMQEFAIAIIGPLASLFIGVVSTLAGIALGGQRLLEQAQRSPEAAFAGLNVLPTLLLWLGPVNLLLALFNLVPGFPLDGGRVLRAILWQLTGDLVKATRWAAGTGQLVAVLLIAWGVVRAFSGVLSGVWLALIGWFLFRAARSSHLDLLVRQSLRGVRVRDLMRTHFNDVQAREPLARFVDEELLRGSQTAWPVLDGDKIVGLVTLENVAAIPEQQRADLRVGDAMSRDAPMVEPDLEGADALRAMTGAPAVPVVERGQVIGLLHREDLARWLAIREMLPV